MHGTNISVCHQDQGAEKVSLGLKESPLKGKPNAIPVWEQNICFPSSPEYPKRDQDLQPGSLHNSDWINPCNGPIPNLLSLIQWFTEADLVQSFPGFVDTYMYNITIPYVSDIVSCLPYYYSARTVKQLSLNYYSEK